MHVEQGRKCVFAIVVVWLSLLWVNAQPPVKRTFSLRAETGDFWKLFDRGVKLGTVAEGFIFTEGPAWDEHGFLYVSDEQANRIFRVFPDGRKELFLEIGDPDGSTFDRKGRFINCASIPRAVIAIEPDGKYKAIADKFEGNRFSSPNDVVSGPDGALYFTDPTLDLPKTEKQEIPFTGVYRLDDNGSVRLLIKDLRQPNGLAFSPDGKRLYVDDSSTRNIHVYDFNKNAEVSNGRVLGTQQGPKGTGGADGMRVDVKGNIYATGPEGIWIWSPEGKHLGTIILPENAANCAWGDQDYRTLYITASTSVYRIRTKIKGFVPYKARR